MKKVSAKKESIYRYIKRVEYIDIRIIAIFGAKNNKKRVYLLLYIDKNI